MNASHIENGEIWFDSRIFEYIVESQRSVKLQIAIEKCGNKLTLTKVETAWTLLVFRKMDEVSAATLKPIAHEVYPFNLITS